MNELLELWNKHTFKITAVIVAPLLLAWGINFLSYLIGLYLL
jgi:hypothetical protein